MTTTESGLQYRDINGNDLPRLREINGRGDLHRTPASQTPLSPPRQAEHRSPVPASPVHPPALPHDGEQRRMTLNFGLKQRSREFRLPHDAPQCAATEGNVKGNGNGYSRCLQPPLHDPVTTALAHGNESILFENTANLQAGKNPELTQLEPQPALRRPRCENAGRLPRVKRFRKTA